MASPRDEMVAAVKEYASKTYCYSHGWDVVIECWSDQEIADCIANATTINGAIRKVREVVLVQYSHRLEIEATAF